MVATLHICGLKIPRPLQKHLLVSLTTFAIFFTAFLLFLLVGLSLPIIRSIYIVKVSALNSKNPVSNAATGLVFGIWGVCATNALNPAAWSEFCYGPQLGYTIPMTLLEAAKLSTKLAHVAGTSLLVLLLLHLVVAGLSTVIFILSLFLHSHAVAVTALIVAVVAAILATIVFAADVALVLGVKDNIDSLFSGADFTVQFGNAVWMVLAGMILTWVAVVILSARTCYCCGVQHQVSYSAVKQSAPEAAEMSVL